MSEMHEGGCVCGGVRYRTRGAPRRVAACSCTWCQKRSGSALGVSVYFDEADVEFLSGSMTTYRLKSEAGRWLEPRFCEVCGTTVTWTLELRPGMVGIAGGTFDQPTFWYDLDAYVFARTKPDWLGLPESLEVYEAGSYPPYVPDPKAGS